MRLSYHLVLKKYINYALYQESFLLLTISIFIPIVLFEIGLRIDGRYSNLVSVDLYGSNTIWTRYPLEEQEQQNIQIKKSILKLNIINMAREIKLLKL